MTSTVARAVQLYVQDSVQLFFYSMYKIYSQDINIISVLKWAGTGDFCSWSSKLIFVSLLCAENPGTGMCRSGVRMWVIWELANTVEVSTGLRL